MNLFSESEFPSLGSSSEASPEKTMKKDSVVSIVSKEELVRRVGGNFHKECFICGSKGDIPRGEWSYQVFLRDKGLCKGCCSRTPRIEILKRYIDETKPEQCRQWIESHGGSLDELQTVSEWVIKDAHLWPHEHSDEVKEADIYQERWESLHYWSVWVREKRFRGEKVAWYSMRQNKMVIGTVIQVKEGGICQVYREPETEEEKELGNLFQKDIKTIRLMPPLSQEAALKLMRSTPGMRRPKYVSPFKCCGPCDRVRISLRAPGGPWDGPHESPHIGNFCKDCVSEMQISERDRNLDLALQYYSDREHRGFGGVYVDNAYGRPGRTFRTCSCSSCSYPSHGNPHLKQGYVCEDCGEKGNGCEGWFDRTSPMGGLPCDWEKEDHWSCKKCWIGSYWLPGKWEMKEDDDSIWFKSR
jgi:hypothetical protein